MCPIQSRTRPATEAAPMAPEPSRSSSRPHLLKPHFPCIGRRPQHQLLAEAPPATSPFPASLSFLPLPLVLSLSSQTSLSLSLFSLLQEPWPPRTGATPTPLEAATHRVRRCAPLLFGSARAGAPPSVAENRRAAARSASSPALAADPRRAAAGQRPRRARARDEDDAQPCLRFGSRRLQPQHPAQPTSAWAASSATGPERLRQRQAVSASGPCGQFR